eukprot:TRINITY_DN27064_c1_g1_i2.p1 TRINITY_DN27064_c1_g1~~TRINITY_DN27064_c1_g1_i2.p1  ORF type:complete len:336 (+),score=57.29 TRINITY_DN27064_c1_g1_i2:44-1009(+)
MLSRHSDDKAQNLHESHIVGSYLSDLVKCTVLEPNVNDQGKVLHKAITDNASIDVIRIMMTRMSAEVMNFKSGEYSFNTLQIVYSARYQLISLMESYCDEDMLSKHSDDKILGSYLPRLVKCKGSLYGQRTFLHDSLAASASNNVIHVIIKKMSPEAVNFESGKILGSYMPRLVESCFLQPNVKNQNELLQKAIYSASTDLIRAIIRRVSGYVKEYTNEQRMNLIDRAAGKGNIYDIIYGAIETPENKRKHYEFQGKKLPRGTKVRKGRDWSDYYDVSGCGVVTSSNLCWRGTEVEVEWNNGRTHSCRFGSDGKYEVRVTE